MRYPKGILAKAGRIRLLMLDGDGVLSDGGMWFDAEGREVKRFDAKDAHGLGSLLGQARPGIVAALCSRAPSAIVERRCLKLGVRPCAEGEPDKARAVQRAEDEFGVPRWQICFVGDDLPDLPAMAMVGLAVAVADAEEEVRRAADWVTPRSGGRGAVRDVVNLLLAARKKTLDKR